MDENTSWVANQPDQGRLARAPPGGHGLSKSESGTPQRPKPKQPFLRKGSGSVEKRLEASRQRKYVPKGGFLTGSPEETAASGCVNNSTLQLDGRGSTQPGQTEPPQGKGSPPNPEIKSWQQPLGAGAVHTHQQISGDSEGELGGHIHVSVDQPRRAVQSHGQRQPLAPISLNSKDDQMDDFWEALGTRQPANLALGLREQITPESMVPHAERIGMPHGLHGGQMEEGGWNAKQATEEIELEEFQALEREILREMGGNTPSQGHLPGDHRSAEVSIAHSQSSTQQCTSKHPDVRRLLKIDPAPEPSQPTSNSHGAVGLGTDVYPSAQALPCPEEMVNELHGDRHDLWPSAGPLDISRESQTSAPGPASLRDSADEDYVREDTHDTLGNANTARDSLGSAALRTDKQDARSLYLSEDTHSQPPHDTLQSQSILGGQVKDSRGMNPMKAGDQDPQEREELEDVECMGGTMADRERRARPLQGSAEGLRGLRMVSGGGLRTGIQSGLNPVGQASRDPYRLSGDLRTRVEGEADPLGRANRDTYRVSADLRTEVEGETNRVELDDESAWDTASMAISAGQGGRQERLPSRQLAGSGGAHGNCHSKEGVQGQLDEAASTVSIKATSPFVQELFFGRPPGAKGTAKVSTKSKAAKHEAEQTAAVEEEVRLLQEERSKVANLKIQLEQAVARLDEERAAIGRLKADEMEEWEREKDKELQRLKRDRRILEKQTRTLLKLPTRKERSEVEAVEAVLEEERRNSRMKDARHRLTVERMRRQIVELQDRNNELREEVRYLEGQVLASRQAAARDRQPRSTPRGPPVTAPPALPNLTNDPTPAPSNPCEASSTTHRPNASTTFHPSGKVGVTGQSASECDGMNGREVPPEAAHDGCGAPEQPLHAFSRASMASSAGGGSSGQTYSGIGETGHCNGDAMSDLGREHEYCGHGSQGLAWGGQTAGEQEGGRKVLLADSSQEGNHFQANPAEEDEPAVDAVNGHTGFRVSHGAHVIPADPPSFGGGLSQRGPRRALTLAELAVETLSCVRDADSPGHTDNYGTHRQDLAHMSPRTLYSAADTAIKSTTTVRSQGYADSGGVSTGTGCGTAPQLPGTHHVASNPLWERWDRVREEARDACGAHLVPSQDPSAVGQDPHGTHVPHGGMTNARAWEGMLPPQDPHALGLDPHGTHVPHVGPTDARAWEGNPHASDAPSAALTSSQAGNSLLTCRASTAEPAAAHPSYIVEEGRAGGVCQASSFTNVPASGPLYLGEEVRPMYSRLPKLPPLNRPARHPGPEDYDWDGPQTALSALRSTHPPGWADVGVGPEGEGRGGPHRSGERSGNMSLYTSHSPVLSGENGNPMRASQPAIDPRGGHHERYANPVLAASYPATGSRRGHHDHCADPALAPPMGGDPRAVLHNHSTVHHSQWIGAKEERHVHWGGPGEAHDTRSNLPSRTSPGLEPGYEYPSTVSASQNAQAFASEHIYEEWHNAGGYGVTGALARPDTGANGVTAALPEPSHAHGPNQAREYPAESLARDDRAAVGGNPTSQGWGRDVREGFPGGSASGTNSGVDVWRSAEAGDTDPHMPFRDCPPWGDRHVGAERPARAAEIGGSDGAFAARGAGATNDVEYIVKETRSADGKVEAVYSSGRTCVTFANGTAKVTWPDGASVIYFANEDIKNTLPNGKVEYLYAEVSTWHTTYPDGLEVFHFPNGQTEAHHPGGLKEIVFPDGSVRLVLRDGREQDAELEELSPHVRQPKPVVAPRATTLTTRA